MKQHKYIVPVPKPHKSAYNPDRPVSYLVRNQILHMSVAERSLEKRHQSPLDVHAIRTEAQASEYIEHLTKKLHGRAKQSKQSKKNKPRPEKSLRSSRKVHGKG